MWAVVVHPHTDSSKQQTKKVYGVDFYDSSFAANG